MIIDHHNKVVYLGVPQTGSTFIHEACKDNKSIFVDSQNLKHSRASTAMRMGAIGYEYMLFVRNHVDCFKSEWNLMKRVANNGINYIDKMQNGEWKNKCLDFYENNPNIDCYINSKLDHKINCEKFLWYIDIECHATYLKYEKFQESCSILFNKLKMRPPNTDIKINHSQNTKLDIEEKTKQKIISCFEKEMRIFGYI